MPVACEQISIRRLEEDIETVSTALRLGRERESRLLVPFNGGRTDVWFYEWFFIE